MPSPILCVRLPALLLASLQAFCAVRGQPSSEVMRLALADLLAHPERYDALVEQRQRFVPLDHAALMAALGISGDQHG
jgi:hypothetical protein